MPTVETAVAADVVAARVDAMWKKSIGSLAALALFGCGSDDESAGASTPKPPTGTFPAIEDPWAQGPYTPVTVTETGPDRAYTLFRPEQLAPGGVRNPIVVWGNGGGTTPSLYTTLPHLASHGFVVIAANSTLVSGTLLRAGLDWVFEQHEDPNSELYQKLDTAKVGAMGYSLGSLAIYQIIDDPRWVTTIHASGGMMSDPRDPVLAEPGPTAYFCDGMDTKANCDGDYAAVRAPVFYGTLLEAVHITVFLPPFVARVNGATTAWFRWHLMDDVTQRSVFLGSDCALCRDPNWTVQSKNWD